MLVFASHRGTSTWMCTTLYITVSPQIRKKYVAAAGQGRQAGHEVGREAGRGAMVQWGVILCCEGHGMGGHHVMEWQQYCSMEW